jgi:hypothetical protein
VKRRVYEALQLKLIAQSYIERGFDVAYEAMIEGVGAYRFDAVARKGRDELVIIEMVNKRRSGDQSGILHALEAIRQGYPHAKVDFRYIDVDAAAAQIERANLEGIAHPSLEDTLNTRLPRRPPDGVDATRAFLDLWRLHVALIRAYARRFNNFYVLLDSHEQEFSNNEGVLDVYNDLLRYDFLSPPEEMVEADIKDLFELYDGAKAALEGVPINTGMFDQLREHFMDVRRQVRMHLR